MPSAGAVWWCSCESEPAFFMTDQAEAPPSAPPLDPAPRRPGSEASAGLQVAQCVLKVDKAQ